MRLESLILGVVILGFGIFLVSTNGVVAGVNLPGVIGFPSCSGGTPNNSTSPQCYGTVGFGVGTIVCFFGLGMIANGLRAPPRTSRASAGAQGVPPGFAASLAPTRPGWAASTAPGAAPGVRYCPECGRANAADAKFCQGCGKTIPPPPTATLDPPPPPTTGT